MGDESPNAAPNVALNEAQNAAPNVAPSEAPNAAQNADAPAATNTQQTDAGKDTELQQERAVLKYGARHIVLLFKPITLAMLVSLVLTLMDKNIQEGDANQRQNPIFLDKNGRGASTGSVMGDNLVNVVIFICLICGMTFMVLLCAMYCFKVLVGFLVFEFCLVCVLSWSFLAKTVFTFSNVAVDWFTLVFCMVNVSVASVCAIFWHGPIQLEQMFLTCTCGIISVIIGQILPADSIWLILLALSAWDIFAVLAPCGPLNLLIQTMQAKDIQLGQGLVYTAGGIINIEPNTRMAAGQDVAPVDQDKSADKEEVDDEDSHIKLGLGDFVFYSLLISRAALDAHAVTLVGCFVCVLVGLAGTLIVLAVYKRALPALPFSMVAGVVFYYFGENYMTPFLHEMNYNMIII